MNNKITKAVIPVAGFGTRFLPFTKAQPKEMLPIIDKPVVQYIIEEAVASGIEDIILVTGQSKRTIENHFDYNHELEIWLEKTGKRQALKEIRDIADMANFIYIRQKGPYGNGTPILNAEKIIGNEPFAVLFGDDLFIGHKKPILKQLIEVYEKYRDPVLAAYQIDKKDTQKYGIIDGQKIEENVFQVRSVIEKPEPKEAPSTIASLGDYILTPDIFEALRNTSLDKRGELCLLNAISMLSKKRPIYACQIEGRYYDIGSKLGWLQANVELALKHKELKEEFKKYLKSLNL